MRLAYQPPGGGIEVDLAGGRSLDAQFVLDAAAEDAVAPADAAVGVWQELRHDEQTDAFHTRRRIRQTSQHQVDNVFGQVVLTGRNEDFRAADREAPVGLGHRLGS